MGRIWDYILSEARLILWPKSPAVSLPGVADDAVDKLLIVNAGIPDGLCDFLAEGYVWVWIDLKNDQFVIGRKPKVDAGIITKLENIENFFADSVYFFHKRRFEVGKAEVDIPFLTVPAVPFYPVCGKARPAPAVEIERALPDGKNDRPFVSEQADV